MVIIEELNNYYLHPGYIFASQEPHLVHTVLGSCVSVCLWDSNRKFGGICHYIYSHLFNNESNAKYGEIAIPHLFKLMNDLGSERIHLKAHIVGGGENPHFHSIIGAENAAIAEKLVGKFNIEVMTKDIKGDFGRKVIFNSGSGEILIYKIKEIRKDDWYGNFNTKNQSTNCR